MLEPHGQLFTLGGRVLVQGGDDLEGREEEEKEEVRRQPGEEKEGRGGWGEQKMVSFDIGGGVTRAVIVCERHLGETDSLICLSILFISFCLSFLSLSLSLCLTQHFIFYPTPQVAAATHNGRLKKINSRSNFPIHIPEKCFQLKFYTITLLAYQK